MTSANTEAFTVVDIATNYDFSNLSSSFSSKFWMDKTLDVHTSGAVVFANIMLL